MATDYYTTEMLHQIWPENWYNGMFGSSSWFDNSVALKPIAPMFQSFYPYACHACARGTLTNTNLSTCSGCRVVKYCCRDHQRADWKKHKNFCKAFKQVREQVSMDAKSREEWQASAQTVSDMMSTQMELARHSDDVQIPWLQPHCRKCFKAEQSREVELVACPRCAGVALCKDCLGDVETTEGYEMFHFETDDALKECNEHLLSLCCKAMIVEQGNPLGMPCLTDAASYWRPPNWIDYFRRKYNDYEVPSPLFNMAPIPAFLSDAHSTVLTIQHVLGLPQVGHDTSSTELVVHICGAAINDEMMPGRYVEMIRLNPQLKKLELHFVGPKLTLKTEDMQRAVDLERIRSTCTLSVHCHEGLYHEVALGLPRPSIAFCTHPGLCDDAYTRHWLPTMNYFIENNTLLVLTGYNHRENLEDSEVMRGWGARVIVSPTPNPFRGLRPFLDPARQPNDMIFTNSSFAVFQGANV